MVAKIVMASKNIYTERLEAVVAAGQAHCRGKKPPQDYRAGVGWRGDGHMIGPLLLFLFYKSVIFHLRKSAIRGTLGTPWSLLATPDT